MLLPPNSKTAINGPSTRQPAGNGGPRRQNPGEAKPRIKFTSPGNYTIQVEVANDCDQPSQKTQEIKVVQDQLPAFVQANSCLGIVYTPNPVTPGAVYSINGTVQNSFPINFSFTSTQPLHRGGLFDDGMRLQNPTRHLSGEEYPIQSGNSKHGRLRRSIEWRCLGCAIGRRAALFLSLGGRPKHRAGFQSAIGCLFCHGYG